MKKYFKKHALKNSLIILAIIIISFIQVGTSLIHTFAFNALIENSLLGFVKWYGIGLVLWISFILGHYFLEISKTKVIQQMILDMRKDYIQKITQQSFSLYKSEDVGEYVSTLNNDMGLIEASGFQSVFNIISTISLTLLSLITLLSFDIKIMVITVIMTFVLTLAPNFLTKRVAKATEEFSDSNSLFLSRIHDMITGYETLYYLGNKKNIIKQIQKASTEYKESKVGFARISGAVNSMISFISVIAQIIIMVATGYLAFIGTVSFGAITSTASVAGNVFGSLSSFNQYLMSIKSVGPIINKITATAHTEQETASSKEKTLSPFHRLTIRDLSFRFGEKQVFDQMNLDIEKGKNYALIGTSGSGKSTLVNLILGNLKNYEGSLRFNLHEVKDIDENEIINQISFVGNQVHIYRDTLLNNITLWEEYTEEEIREAIRDSNLEELEHKLHEPITANELSEGQKQRIGLARAFLKNRMVIISDEATSNLDSKNSREIEDLILSRDELTYITITHHLTSERRNLFDQVITLVS